MAWWTWVLVGLALLVVEIVTPGGLFALFFGFGALVVAALVAVDAAGSPTVQWLIFTVVSVGSLVVLRRQLSGKLTTRSTSPELVGEVAIPLQDLHPRGVGKVELRGTSWDARNTGDAVLSKGQRCHVVRVEGLTLWVAPE